MSRTFVGMPPFPSAAREALGDTQLRHNLAHATGVIRDKRARLVEEQGDLWEPLRLAGAAVKQRALDDLATHLEQLEASLTAAGATVHTGGETLGKEGYFYAPTVLSDIAEGVRIVDEEQFGPALPVMPFQDIDDVLERANGTHFGAHGMSQQFVQPPGIGDFNIII